MSFFKNDLKNSVGAEYQNKLVANQPQVLVDYCDIFSALWTLILTAPIHCRGSTGEQAM